MVGVISLTACESSVNFVNSSPVCCFDISIIRLEKMTPSSFDLKLRSVLP
jgi:hypothetical protein